MKFLDLLPLAKGHFDCRCSTKHTGSNNLKSILSFRNDLEIIPVLNKVDLQVRIEEVSDDIVDLAANWKNIMRREKLV
jgi:hypothetical protein